MLIILKIIKSRGRPKYNEIESTLLQGLFDFAIFTIGINLFVFLGNPVYSRWLLDGSDPDLR